jgi:hypothetical protein
MSSLERRPIELPTTPHIICSVLIEEEQLHLQIGRACFRLFF